MESNEKEQGVTMKTTLTNLLLGGAIVSPKSGKLIENIHTVEDKWFGTVIGGTVTEYPYGILGTAIRYTKYTTIEIVED